MQQSKNTLAHSLSYTENLSGSVTEFEYTRSKGHSCKSHPITAVLITGHEPNFLSQVYERIKVIMMPVILPSFK